MHAGTAMGEPSPDTIHRWSTVDVLPGRRLDHYAEMLTQAIDPMYVASRNTGAFQAKLSSIEMGPLTVIHGIGTTHHCMRGDREIARTAERSFHLVVNSVSPWSLAHRGPLSLRAGDAVLLYSQYAHEFRFPCFDNVHLKLPESWVRQWVADPDILVGRCIPFDSPWGRALTSFVMPLTPEFVARTSLPPGVIADSLGALLALMADEIGGRSDMARRHDTTLRDRITECIVQRCTEFSLSANDVAFTLNISLRTLHRTLASSRETFSATLMNARIDLAMRMLQSRLHDRVALSEIGRRAGFSDASHFTRVMRNRSGLTPSQIRRGDRNRC